MQHHQGLQIPRRDQLETPERGEICLSETEQKSRDQQLSNLTPLVIPPAFLRGTRR